MSSTVILSVLHPDQQEKPRLRWSSEWRWWMDAVTTDSLQFLITDLHLQSPVSWHEQRFKNVMVYNLNLKLFDYKISFVKLINNNEFRYLKKDRLYPNIYIYLTIFNYFEQTGLHCSLFYIVYNVKNQQFCKTLNAA